MNFSRLVPSVFYTDMSDGLQLFVDCLQFSIAHEDFKASQPYCVLEKDGIRIKVFQDMQLADEHYPELRLETGNIDKVFATVSASPSPAAPKPEQSYTKALGRQRICGCRQAGWHTVPAMVKNQ